ncbi:MAG: pyruvate kinase [Candidatus Dojkabacteria bacterium]|jgi:pyruvate kinase|nr:pyruvate kinase [Candidatus Dojkabacteria bacterium]MDD4561066.1 pyruvate kinase [Candidatus Dojkabacteria bacterium]NLB12242.1 pyruvate kinase [Candidatus Dojkabacteria bacterium]
MKNLAATKIIATIGPSSWDRDILEEMFKNGMQIARINASFADLTEVARVTETLREISPRITIMLDTQGAKIRVVDLEEEINILGTVSLSSFNSYIPSTIKISYPDLHLQLAKDTSIFLDDGLIELSVSEVKGSEIICNVVQSGLLKPNKTVNIPSINLNFPSITEKDKKDIQIALDQKLDYLSISFVRNANDLLNVKELIGESDIKIVVKIENREGVENFDEILELTDAVMIARGDLGVETPLENVPILQKQIIYKCRSKGKPVIVATQMLESMKNNIKPTRAEVSDVVNAIMDGTDALMLSAETSTGKNPIEAVKTMNKIALNTESVMKLTPIYGATSAHKEVDEISRNVALLTESLPLKGIIIFSDDKGTIASISRHRPTVPIWSISSDIKRVRQDSIFRSVKSFYINDLSDDRDDSIFKAMQTVYTYEELDLTDKVAIITGSSIKNKKDDLILEIATVKDVLFN